MAPPPPSVGPAPSTVAHVDTSPCCLHYRFVSVSILFTSFDVCLKSGTKPDQTGLNNFKFDSNSIKTDKKKYGKKERTKERKRERLQFDIQTFTRLVLIVFSVLI